MKTTRNYVFFSMVCKNLKSLVRSVGQAQLYARKINAAWPLMVTDMTIGSLNTGGNEVDLTVNGGPECQLRVLGLAHISSETASNLLATQPIFYNF